MKSAKVFDKQLSECHWKEVVALTEDLPLMPDVALKAITLLNNENVSSVQLSEILSKDTALVGRILKIANSALFSRQREIGNIKDATVLIGYKALKGIIYAASVRKMYEDMSIVQERVWEHSIATATFATNIAEALKKSYEDEVFLYGMLHSLGQLALLNLESTKESYLKVIDLIKQKSLSYLEAEQKVFGFTHALVGALVAKKWNFPLETCYVILHYLDPYEVMSFTDIQSEKTVLIRLSSLLAHKVAIGSPEGYKVDLKEITLLARALGFNKNTYKKDLDLLCANTKMQVEKEKENY
ncbi:MAG: HDOD domain-containing protein [Bdellovibrionota bacterium]|jgi:HD-like signal output (HDOD) protein